MTFQSFGLRRLTALCEIRTLSLGPKLWSRPHSQIDPPPIMPKVGSNPIHPPTLLTLSSGGRVTARAG